MLSKCQLCGQDYNLDLKEDRRLVNYVPPVCSAPCFKDLVTGEIPLFPEDKKHWRNLFKAEEYAESEWLMFRSDYERGFHRFLMRHTIKILYEPYRLTLPGGEWYVPDFYSIDGDLFLEVKGIAGKSGLPKFKTAAKMCPGTFYLIPIEFLKLIDARPFKGRFYAKATRS